MEETYQWIAGQIEQKKEIMDHQQISQTNPN
jgi:hypothetical protein